jgi:hypothetical protein
LLIGFGYMLAEGTMKAINLGQHLGKHYLESVPAMLLALVMFGGLAAVLFWVGVRPTPPSNGDSWETPPGNSS